MRFIFYKGNFPELIDPITVTKIVNSDSTVTLHIEGTDQILSYQNDGTWQTRHEAAIGPWEKCIIEGNVATFNSFGTIGHFGIFQIPN